MSAIVMWPLSFLLTLAGLFMAAVLGWSLRDSTRGQLMFWLALTLLIATAGWGARP